MDELFVDESSSIKGDEYLTVMATRIATVFASLRVCNSNLSIMIYCVLRMSKAMHIWVVRNFLLYAIVLPNPLSSTL